MLSPEPDLEAIEAQRTCDHEWEGHKNPDKAIVEYFSARNN